MNKDDILNSSIPEEYKKLLSDNDHSTCNRKDHFIEKPSRIKKAGDCGRNYGVFKEDFPAVSGSDITNLYSVERGEDRKDIMLEYQNIVGVVWESPTTKKFTNLVRMKRTPDGTPHTYPVLPVFRKDEKVTKLA